MKFIMTLLITLTSLSAFSQSGNIRIGQGEWICSAEGIDQNPSLARGRNRMEAQQRSLDACAQIEGSSFFCKVKQCEQDKNRRNVNIDINFEIDRNGSSVNIRLSNGNAGFMCQSKAFMDTYIAEAPTKLEAEVLVRQVCISDGNHGMHCKVRSCETMAPSSDSRRPRINIGGFLGGIGIDINDI